MNLKTIVAPPGYRLDPIPDTLKHGTHHWNIAQCEVEDLYDLLTNGGKQPRHIIMTRLLQARPPAREAFFMSLMIGGCHIPDFPGAPGRGNWVAYPENLSITVILNDTEEWEENDPGAANMRKELCKFL